MLPISDDGHKVPRVPPSMGRTDMQGRQVLSLHRWTWWILHIAVHQWARPTAAVPPQADPLNTARSLHRHGQDWPQVWARPPWARAMVTEKHPCPWQSQVSLTMALGNRQRAGHRQIHTRKLDGLPVYQPTDGATNPLHHWAAPGTTVWCHPSAGSTAQNGQHSGPMGRWPMSSMCCGFQCFAVLDIPSTSLANDQDEELLAKAAVETGWAPRNIWSPQTSNNEWCQVW